jgi:DNA-binding response OmpR family regulator
LRLLLVEDEPFSALDLQILSEAAGHEVVGVADTLETALTMAGETRPDAALVDINLRDGFSGVRVSKALSGSAVAVGFVTGNAEQIPADFAGAVAVLEKPFSDAGVVELLSILEGSQGGPGCFERSPRYARLAPAV